VCTRVYEKLDLTCKITACNALAQKQQDMLKGVCAAKGLDFDEYLSGLKKKGQWHVEVY